MIVDMKEMIEESILGLKKEFEGKPKKRVLFVTFGMNPAARSFLDSKSKIAERVGVEALVRESEADTTEDAVRFVREKISEDYDGIVIQLPLPKSVLAEEVFSVIPEDKDIDILSKTARLAYAEGRTERVPPVAGAVRQILERYDADLNGKKVLILGRGRLVGRPVSAMFEKLGIGYDITDANTLEADRLRLLALADVIVTGMGTPYFIKPEMIKEGAMIIDAGTSEQGGKFVGDADPACGTKASVLTPVPGGVGPLAVTNLFRNLVLTLS